MRLYKIENKENSGFIGMMQHSYKTILMAWSLKASKTIELARDHFQIDIYLGHKKIRLTVWWFKNLFITNLLNNCTGSKF